MNLERVYNICQEKNFIDEFLFLSINSLHEAKTNFLNACEKCDVNLYQQTSHKIKTNLSLLNLTDLQNLIESGKYILINDESKISQFENELMATLDDVIFKISHLSK